MSSSSKPAISPDRPLARPAFYSLLQAAIEVSEWRYARRIATAWLAAFPGDLPVKFQFAQAIVQDRQFDAGRQALDLLEELCLLDPEYTAAQRLLATLRHTAGLDTHFISKGCVHALSHTPHQLAEKGEIAPIWARQLQEARTSLSKYLTGSLPGLDKAEHAIHQALVENPETPLAAVTHLNIMSAKYDLPAQALLSLAQIYHARWPTCLQFSLILADRLMDSGDSTQAVELLHQVVAKDITGQVAHRLWGVHHPYSTLWPEIIEISPIGLNSPQCIPVPAIVAARLGWNQLPSHASDEGTHTTFSPVCALSDAPTVPLAALKSQQPTHNAAQSVTKSIPVPRPQSGPKLSEPARLVQTELNRLAKQLKSPGLATLDGRFPVYVVFTTRKGLENQYGSQGAALIDDELKKLVRAVRGQRIDHETWGAILLYADDPEYTSFFDLQPAPHNDAWALKLLLADIDTALGKGGEKIGAILLVGGPEVVPFHRLPNPVDDADAEVLSDNPYASLSENYFVPEWPLGRLPGSSSKDPSDLLAALRALIRRYLEASQTQPWLQKLLTQLYQLIRQKTRRIQSSFGYTAAIWRRASLAVYRTIGSPQELLVSPPVRSCDLDADGTPLPTVLQSGDTSACLLMPGTRLAYFNLHGIPDSPFWYGHRDPSEPLPGIEFPVAIRPQDVRNGGSAPQLIFSEACYGAHILGKGIDEALALKFLASGSHAVVASTCISYGSISTPLSAADLLGRIFWGLLEEGLHTAEALRRAKLQLVREMHRRQGYLDPEDQKTIISFVLYGDPLARVFHPQRRSKSLSRSAERLSRRAQLPREIHTVSENPQPTGTPAPLSPQVVAQVKSIVAQYLPGMSDATLHLTQSNLGLTDLTPLDGIPPVSSPQAHSTFAGRQVVALSKTVQQANLAHAQYARLTIDASGKLLKLTVSR